MEDLAGDEDDAELEQDRVVVGRQDAAGHRAIHGRALLFFLLPPLPLAGSTKIYRPTTN